MQVRTFCSVRDNNSSEHSRAKLSPESCPKGATLHSFIFQKQKKIFHSFCLLSAWDVNAEECLVLFVWVLRNCFQKYEIGHEVPWEFQNFCRQKALCYRTCRIYKPAMQGCNGGRRRGSVDTGDPCMQSPAENDVAKCPSVHGQWNIFDNTENQILDLCLQQMWICIYLDWSCKRRRKEKCSLKLVVSSHLPLNWHRVLHWHSGPRVPCIWWWTRQQVQSKQLRTRCSSTIYRHSQQDCMFWIPISMHNATKPTKLGFFFSCFQFCEWEAYMQTHMSPARRFCFADVLWQVFNSFESKLTKTGTTNDHRIKPVLFSVKCCASEARTMV